MASSAVRKEKGAAPLWRPAPPEERKKSGAFMASYSYLLPTSVASKKSKIPFVIRSS
jgi:hypothetical protein